MGGIYQHYLGMATERSFMLREAIRAPRRADWDRLARQASRDGRSKGQCPACGRSCSAHGGDHRPGPDGPGKPASATKCSPRNGRSPCSAGCLRGRRASTSSFPVPDRVRRARWFRKHTKRTKAEGCREECPLELRNVAEPGEMEPAVSACATACQGTFKPFCRSFLECD